MTKTIAKQLKEVQELIQETQRLQEKYPHNKKGLEIGLQSLMEIEKEMTQAVISKIKKIILDYNNGEYNHSSEALADIIETLKEEGN